MQPRGLQDLGLPRNLFPNTVGWGLRHPPGPTQPSSFTTACKQVLEGVMTRLPGRDGDREERGAVPALGVAPEQDGVKTLAQGSGGCPQNSASNQTLKDAVAGPGLKVRASSQRLARAWRPKVR